MPMIAYYQFFPRGGVARYTHELLSAMSETDNDFCLICPSDYEFIDRANYAVKPILKSATKSRSKWLNRFFFVKNRVDNSRLLFDFCRREKPKIVHFFEYSYLFDLYYLKRIRKLGTQLFFTAHDPFPMSFFFSKNIELKLIRNLYKLADGIIVHANLTKKALAERFGISDKKIAVIPHGVGNYNYSKFTKLELRNKFSIGENKKILLIFGLVAKRKGIDLFLEALSQVNNPEVMLLLVGTIPSRREPLKEFYQEIIDRLKLNEKVLWVDRWIDESEIPDFFEVADYSIIPYRKEFRSMSGVLYLSFHYKKPVLVTDVGVIGELVNSENLGLCVEPESPEALAQGVEELLKFSDDENPFAENVEKFLDRCRWTQIAPTTRKFYKLEK